MIKFTTGDMFHANADCMVNTVNCEGYMGKGIAYQFKCLFPENNRGYTKECKAGRLTPGNLYIFVESGITIINFPTKDKWREPSQISYIEEGLDALVFELPKLQVKTIAIPPLGCGNGGLEWKVVKQLIIQKLNPIENEYDFLVFEPGKSYTQKVKSVPKLSVSSLVLMRIKLGLNKKSKLRLQKSAYFMTVFADDPYFVFQKHKYGPYCHAIDIISREIGEYQKFYGLKDTEEAYQLLYQTICSKKTDDVLNRMLPAAEKATNFVNNIEDEHILEGVSTVLFLIQTYSECTDSALISLFKGWSTDKAARYSESEILEYIVFLEEKEIIGKNILGYYYILPCVC